MNRDADADGSVSPKEAVAVRKNTGMLRLSLSALALFVAALSVSVALVADGRSLVAERYGMTVRPEICIVRHRPQYLLADSLSSVTVRLPVENPWSESITIEAVESSCGCSRTDLAERIVSQKKPSTLIAVVTFPPSGDSKQLHFTMKCADGRLLVHHLNLSAYPRIASVRDEGLNVAPVLAPSQKSKELQIPLLVRRDTEDISVEILTVTCSSPYVSIAVDGSETHEAGGDDMRPWHESRRALRAVIARGTPGFHAANIAIAYAVDGELNRASIPIRWQVESAWDVSPSRIFLALGTEANRNEVDEIMDVILARTDGRPFDVVALNSSAPWLRVEEIPADAPRRSLRITVLKREISSDAYAELTIRTVDPTEPEIVIPVGVKIPEN